MTCWGFNLPPNPLQSFSIPFKPINSNPTYHSQGITFLTLQQEKDSHHANSQVDGRVGNMAVLSPFFYTYSCSYIEKDGLASQLVIPIVIVFFEGLGIAS